MPDCRSIYLASPYFGRSTGGIDLLDRKYPGSRKFIFPGRHPGGEIDIDIDEVRSSFPEAKINVLKTWAKPDAFAHLKLYAAFSESSIGWFFCTSANCTHSAWTGGNVEAGLLRELSNGEFLKFFQGSDQDLPFILTKPEKDDNDYSSSFPIWVTTDSFNSSFTIYVPSEKSEKIPLEDAEICVSFGGERSIVLKNRLEFTDHKESFFWKDFDLETDKFRGTYCLKISGRTRTGEEIIGECFMDNVGRLSLDPFHRRALRGAESLLEDQDLCEHGEISQLYLFLERGMDEDPVGAKAYTGKSPKDKEEKKFSDSIAIWPPIASEERSLALKAIGSTALGRLDLFNKIVRLLLSEESSSDKESSGDGRLMKEIISDDESGEDPEVGEKIRRQREKEADRLWDSAHRRYTAFLDKLKSWILNEKKAKNFWISATMVLLITLKANGRARERESMSALGNKPDELINLFFAKIFLGSGGALPLSQKLLDQYDIRPSSICVPFLISCIVNERFNRRGEAAPQNMRFGARQINAIISDPNELSPELLSQSWEKWKKLIKPVEVDNQVQSEMTESQFRATYDELVTDYRARYE